MSTRGDLGLRGCLPQVRRKPRLGTGPRFGQYVRLRHPRGLASTSVVGPGPRETRSPKWRADPGHARGVRPGLDRDPLPRLSNAGAISAGLPGPRCCRLAPRRNAVSRAAGRLAISCSTSLALAEPATWWSGPSRSTKSRALGAGADQAVRCPWRKAVQRPSGGEISSRG